MEKENRTTWRWEKEVAYGKFIWPIYRRKIVTEDERKKIGENLKEVLSRKESFLDRTLNFLFYSGLVITSIIAIPVFGIFIKITREVFMK